MSWYSKGNTARYDTYASPVFPNDNDAHDGGASCDGAVARADHKQPFVQSAYSIPYW